MGSSAGSKRRFAEEVYDVVRQIPRGRVLTYGQVAELAGAPGAARAVGAAMRALKAHGDTHGIPWQRVVGRRSRGAAKISILDPVGGAIQREMLREEGVCITEAGTISLAAYGWLPTGTDS